MQSRRMSRSTSSHSSIDARKHSSSDRGRDQDKAPQKVMQGPRCMGCNRTGHHREECHFKTRWDGCKADRELRVRGKRDRDLKLTCLEEHQRLLIRLPHLAAMIRMIEILGDDVTMIVGTVMEVVETIEVVKDIDKGTPCLTSIITHLTCNCGGADINSTYRQCLVSMRNSTTYFTALTLFDLDAYTSFVNREDAKWRELQ